MRRIILGLAVTLLFGTYSAAQTPPRSSDDLPTYDQVGLLWTRAPSVRDMARQHQVATRARGHRGLAEVACTAQADGRLDCQVLNEEPMDLYFGRAALEVMRRTRVAATDGYSPEGRTFGYRLRFGNWPEHLLPDTFHPTDQNLRWVRRPQLAGLHSGGSLTGEEVMARFECTARQDGSLDCAVAEHSGDTRFVQAAERSLADARVERIDGETLAGSPLNWRFRLVRQSNCAGGGTRSGSPDSGRGAVRDIEPGFGHDPLLSADGTAGTQGNAQSAGVCVGAVVQMH